MNLSIKQILGPIMIGPSSSHTAGACKLGYVTKKINHNSIKSVTCYLSGSFYKTHRGHGTDKALIGGILGIREDDIRLKNAFSIAGSSGIQYGFVEEDLDQYHPNTVRFHITNKDGSQTNVIGSSIGGGKVEILKINDFKVSFSGDYATLIINHFDKTGTTSQITNLLSERSINIATMSVTRISINKEASTIIESDTDIPTDITDQLLAIDSVSHVSLINIRSDS